MPNVAVLRPKPDTVTRMIEENFSVGDRERADYISTATTRSSQWGTRTPIFPRSTITKALEGDVLILQEMRFLLSCTEEELDNALGVIQLRRMCE